MADKPLVPTDRLIERFIRSHRHDWSQHNKDGAIRVLNRVHAWLTAQGLTLTHPDPLELVDALDDYLDHRATTPKADGEPRATSSMLVDHRQLAAFYKWAHQDPGDGDRLVARNPMLAHRGPQTGATGPGKETRRRGVAVRRAVGDVSSAAHPQREQADERPPRRRHHRRPVAYRDAPQRAGQPRL